MNIYPTQSMGSTRTNFFTECLRILVWSAALLVLLSPLASSFGLGIGLIAVCLSLFLASHFARTQSPFRHVGATAIATFAIGFGACRFVECFEWPSRLWGISNSILVAECCFFGSTILTFLLLVRSASIRLRYFAIVESGCVMGSVITGFRSHRAFPFSQPQALSDWAFANGYDPRMMIIWIGCAAVVGSAGLLLPIQRSRQTLVALSSIAIAVVLLLPLLIRPVINPISQSSSSPFEHPKPTSLPLPPNGQQKNSPPERVNLDKVRTGFTRANTNPPQSQTPPPPPANRPKQKEDELPRLTVENSSFIEGDAGYRLEQIKVSLSKASELPVSFSIDSSSGSAIANEDMVLPDNQTIEIVPGETSVNIATKIIGDKQVEGTEYFTLRISNPTNAAIARDQATFVIVDDDAEEEVSISIANVNLTEPANGPFVGYAIVTLSAASNRAVSFEFKTNEASLDDLKNNDIQGLRSASLANAEVDFIRTSQAYTIPPGETNLFVPFSILADDEVENLEVFRLQLTEVVRARVERGIAFAIIEQNPSQAELSIDNAIASEDENGTHAIEFRVSLSKKSDKPVTFAYKSIPGTALSGEDFVDSNGSIAIPAGQTEATIRVTLIDDRLVEPDEEFTVQLSQAKNAKMGRATASGKIRNDDQFPIISIEDHVAKEGDVGETTVEIVVKLSTTYPLEIQVDFTTAVALANTDPKTEGPQAESQTNALRADSEQSTATAPADCPSDFIPQTGTLHFLPGETERRVSIILNGDTDFEPDEVFSILLSKPVNATLERDATNFTIRNDDTEPQQDPPPAEPDQPPLEDPLPKLSVNDIQTIEGDDERQAAVFLVSLSEASTKVVQFKITTVSGTARANEDFKPVSKSVSIAVGELNAEISIPLIGDRISEPTESFSVRLSDPSNATIEKETGTASIQDDDPTVSIEDARGVEGDEKESSIPVRLQLSTPAKEAVSVRLTAKSNSANTDFTAIDVRVPFETGAQEVIYQLPVLGDRRIELDEFIQMQILDPRGATLGQATAVATIENDDWPRIRIENITIDELDSENVMGVFQISLSEPGLIESTVEFASIDSSATSSSATAGDDYKAANGTLKFAPGETIKSIEISIKGDTLAELDETFEIRLSNPIGAIVEVGQASCTIVDNDFPTISISDASKEEGDVGVQSMPFEVTLSSASRFEVSVDYEARPTTANMDDFSALKGSLTIAPGDTKASIDVQIRSDVDVEPDESIRLGIFNPINATIVKGLAEGTIINDDVEPNLSIADAQLVEGDHGRTGIQFEVTLDSPLKKLLIIKARLLALESGATLGQDVDVEVLPIRLPAGVATGSMVVEIIADRDVEADEFFQLEIVECLGAKLVRGTAVGTIINDDVKPPLPSISIEDASIDEGNAGETELTIHVRLSEATDHEVQVEYATGSGNALPGRDYRSTSGTLRIAPQEREAVFKVTIIADVDREADETFVAQLSDPVGAVFERDQAIATIRDDDRVDSEDDPSNDEFVWDLSSAIDMHAQAVIKFQSRFEPSGDAIYLRGAAYSRLVNQRFLRDESRDNDVFWTVPSEKTSINSSETLRNGLVDMSYEMHCLSVPTFVSALPQPLVFEPIENRQPKIFQSSFRMTSRIAMESSERSLYADWSKRAAGNDKWDEATQVHYSLQPDDNRFQQLTTEILESVPPSKRNSPIAKMLAIRIWMQNNLLYDYNPIHSTESDPTASYLFGDRRGYCVHLAHAMAMLLRCQGVPSRIATGYRIDATRFSKRYGVMVYSSDAHTWAELYVDGVGWVVAESGTKGRVAEAEPQPDPRELDYYLGLLEEVPEEVFASDQISIVTVAKIGVPAMGCFAILSMYFAKFWRLLVPLFVGVASLYRLGYRAGLDRLAQVGLKREYGETWDEFAERIRPMSPAFVELTSLHLQQSYRDQSTHHGAVHREHWKELQRELSQQIRAATPWQIRWLGWLHPLNWRGVD